MTDDRDEELLARILASPPRNDAERHLHAVLSGTAPPAPEIRHADFAPDDIEGLRAYVAEEVERHGGLSDCVLLMLLEFAIDDSVWDAAMDILDAAPRLGTGRLC